MSKTTKIQDYIDAVIPLQEYCNDTGFIFTQPSRRNSELVSGVQHLRNRNGMLARSGTLTGEII